MPTEVEAKFRADGPGRLAHLATLAALGAAELGPPRTVEEVDTYLDTVSLALHSARWACRLRQRGEVVTVSLKGAADGPASGSELHRRPEVEGPATSSHDPGTWPPSAARDLVDRLRNGAPLHPRCVLRQVRTERAVTSGGSALALLSLDDVTVEARGTERGRFDSVELELVPDARGREDELAAVAAFLGRLPGLQPDPLTKLEHALELIGDR